MDWRRMRGSAAAGFRAMLYGRNGFDALAGAVFSLSVIILVLSSMAEWARTWGYYIAYAGAAYSFFRVFSRNVPKRRRENARFLKPFTHITGKWQAMRRRLRERKTHRFFRCPGCKLMLRVPKGKGKIRITCTRCGERILKKT